MSQACPCYPANDGEAVASVVTADSVGEIMRVTKPQTWRYSAHNPANFVGGASIGVMTMHVGASANPMPTRFATVPTDATVAVSATLRERCGRNAAPPEPMSRGFVTTRRLPIVPFPIGSGWAADDPQGNRPADRLQVSDHARFSRLFPHA